LNRTYVPKAEATDVAGFQTALTAAKSSRDALAASQTLSQNKAQLKAEVIRCKDLANLNDARSATDTKGITRKATDLTGTMQLSKCATTSPAKPLVCIWAR
jgi:hypothetical protein